MATHSDILAWKIPWTEESGGLQSIGSQRVGHDWRDLACMHIDSWILVIILWVIIWYFIIYPIAQIDSALAFGSSFSWLLCPSDLLLWVLSFWYFLPLCMFIHKMLQAHLIYFLCQPWNQPLLWRTLVPLLENGITNQDPGTGCIHCSWTLSTNRVRRCMCVC